MKTPFYMTYPMQNLYQTEMEYEKDMERMKEMYPREVRMILPRIEERCDELEYEGSRIYDENPDRLMMEWEVQKLYEEIKNSNPMMSRGNSPMTSGNTAGKQLQETELLQEERSDGQDTKAQSMGGFALHLPEGWLLPDEQESKQPMTKQPMEKRPMSEQPMQNPPMSEQPMTKQPMPEDAEPEQQQPIVDVEQTPNQPGNYGPGGSGGPAGPKGAGDPFRTGEQFERPPYGPGGTSPGGPENRPPYGPKSSVSAQWRPGPNPPPPCNDWLCGLVGVLFQDEVYRRRCRYRRCHRWW